MSGMIPVNTGYEEMFQVCTATAQITDLEYEIRYRSGKGLEKQESPISKEMMKQTEQGPVILQEGLQGEDGDFLRIYYEYTNIDTKALTHRADEDTKFQLEQDGEMLEEYNAGSSGGRFSL